MLLTSNQFCSPITLSAYTYNNMDCLYCTSLRIWIPAANKTAGLANTRKRLVKVRWTDRQTEKTVAAYWANESAVGSRAPPCHKSQWTAPLHGFAIGGGKCSKPIIWALNSTLFLASVVVTNSLSSGKTSGTYIQCTCRLTEDCLILLQNLVLLKDITTSASQ